VLRQSQLVSWWDIMQQFEPRFLVAISYMCGTHKRSVDEQGYPVLENVLPPITLEYVPQMMGDFAESCTELGLTVCVATLEKLRDVCGRPDSTVGDMQKLMEELRGRILDELQGQRFFYLTLEEARKFNKWNSGWEEILARFPDATRDVEEMNKCFALSRYTAAMFHALHVAEWGAINLGNYIGVTDPKKGWGATEKRLRQLVDGGHSKLPQQLAAKFEFLEQMNREVDSLVLAWRHKVDHAVNHLAIVPNTDFTPDIAGHIIGAVRIFMLRIVEGTKV
jgi:hypothetical protein